VTVPAPTGGAAVPAPTGGAAAPGGAGRALILSGSIGRGQDSAAEACQAAVVAAGGSASILDCMALLGETGRRLGEAAFRRALSVAPLYDALHFSQMRSDTALAERMEEAAARRLVPRLRQEIERSGAQLLVSAFATGVGALGRLRSEMPHRRVVVVCTDAAAHRLWAHPAVDRYIVCSEMTAGTIRQYLPAADVVVLPPAVRPAFFNAPGRAQARDALGIDRAVPCVLLMGGGWGMARLVDAAAGLAGAGYRVLAVAGSNRALRHRLEALARSVPRSDGSGVTVYGYTTEVPALMAACDVVVATPGQTCHEARVVRRPLVVLDAVPGHGRENLLLEMVRGGALACTPRPSSVVAGVASVLDGAVDADAPWPVHDAAEWGVRFLSAVADLMDAPSVVSTPRNAPVQGPAAGGAG
jgi:UDP-N-acetylglucosamine:LPS N-acetylglucosamine transferase